jgi:hypothetical protein
MFVVLVGIRLTKKRAGTDTSGISLLAPASMTRIERPGSASASLAATTHPVVPPGVALVINGLEVGIFETDRQQ